MNHDEGHAQLAIELDDGAVISTRIECGDMTTLGHELLTHFNDLRGRAKLMQAIPFRLHSIRDGEIYYSSKIIDTNLVPTHMTHASVGTYLSRTLHWWNALGNSMESNTEGETFTFEFPTHWYLFTVTGRWMYMNHDMNIPEALTLEVVQNG